MFLTVFCTISVYFDLCLIRYVFLRYKLEIITPNKHIKKKKKNELFCFRVSKKLSQEKQHDEQVVLFKISSVDIFVNSIAGGFLFKLNYLRTSASLLHSASSSLTSFCFIFQCSAGNSTGME